MKKFLSILMSLCMVFSLAACAPKRPTAESALKETLDSIKTLSAPEIKEGFMESLDADNSVNKEQAEKAFNTLLPLLVKNLDYKILECTEEGDTAKAKIEFTNTDMAPVLKNFFQDFVKEIFSKVLSSGQEPSEEEIIDMTITALEKALSADDLKTITITTELDLFYTEENGWDANPDDSFYDAIFGGLLQASQNFDSGLNNLEDILN